MIKEKRIEMIKKSLVLIMVIVTGVFAFSCSTGASASNTTETQTAMVGKGNIANQITSTGNLKMPHYAKLSFGASGTVQEVSVILGDSVKNGQVLAKLDTSTQSTLQQALLQAQVNQKQAQMALENAETPTLSSSNGVVSAPDPLDIESKQIALERAKLAVEDAQRQLDGAVIIAPFDGLVAEINITPEDKVSSGTVAIRIIDPTQLQVDTLVNEMDIFNINLGMAATVQVTALSSLTLPATVFAISPAANISGGVVNYTVQLQAKPPQYKLSVPSDVSNTSGVSNNETARYPAINTSGTSTGLSQLTKQAPSMPTLKEGLSVNVTITIAEKTDVILVPMRAITREGRNAFVEVMKDDGITEKRAVKTGLSDWQNIEVTEGLKEGEKVVLPKSSSSSSNTNTNTNQNRGSTGMTGGGMMIIR